jgi:thiol-disulfide isomerase/thioredoxin
MNAEEGKGPEAAFSVPPRRGPAALQNARDIVSNNRVRLSEAQGKLVFVTFWATWCAACRSELPILENVQKKLGKDKAAV